MCRTPDDVKFFGRAKLPADPQDIIAALATALEPFAAFRTAAKPGKFTDLVVVHFTTEDFERARAALTLARSDG